MFPLIFFDDTKYGTKALPLVTALHSYKPWFAAKSKRAA